LLVRVRTPGRNFGDVSVFQNVMVLDLCEEMKSNLYP
jgi:hypothetical protein